MNGLGNPSGSLQAPDRRGGWAPSLAIVGLLFLGVIQGLLAVVPQETPTVAQDPAPPAAPRIERRVRLMVTADSWREGGPFKIEKELKDKLAAAGVGVVGKNSKKFDGALVVTYNESEGKEYKVLGGEAKVGKGTEIELSVEVQDAEGTALITLAAGGGTPEIVSGNDFFGAALGRLRDHPVYKVLGECVAASLGVKAVLPKLLPSLTWDDSSEIAKELLKGYEAKTPEEAAWLALAEDDYGACVKLGAAALDPLIDVFGRPSEFGEGVNEKLLEALVAIGGPKARQAVLSQLVSKKDLAESYPEDLVRLIQAVTTLEERGAVPVLEELSKGDSEEVAPAAKKALRALKRAGAPAAIPEKSGDVQADRFNERGLERLAAGKWSAATANFTQAIDLAPRHGPFYWNRARSRWNARAWKAALLDLQKAADLVPAREDDARLRIFILRCRLDDRAKASEELQAYATERGGWVAAVAGALLDDASIDDLVDRARRDGDAAKAAQANFYAGMSLVLKGDSRSAAPYLRKCSEAAAAAPVEADAARVELEVLGR
jgi:tetratricopeptide (TPR) repeat protein